MTPFVEMRISGESHHLHHLGMAANPASFAGAAFLSGNVTGSQELQAGDQATGRARAAAEKKGNQALWEVFIADLCRNKSSQPMPLTTPGKCFAEIVNPADNRTPGDCIGPGQHIDAAVAWTLLAKGNDDHNNRPPVHLASEEQTGWRQYPAATIFSAAAKTETDTEFIRYIDRTTTRFSGVRGAMERGMTKGTPGLPACAGKILVYLME